MSKIKVAVVGIGNCASALIQGIHYYAGQSEKDAIGLMHWTIGGYTAADIQIAAAFDIDERKIERDVSEAVFTAPNCTTTFCRDIPHLRVPVHMGRVLDGFAEHMRQYKPKYTIIPARNSEPSSAEIVRILRDSEAEMMLNYLPVGAEKATRFYADCALEAGLAFVNNIPVFIASDPLSNPPAMALGRGRIATDGPHNTTDRESLHRLPAQRMRANEKQPHRQAR